MKLTESKLKRLISEVILEENIDRLRKIKGTPTADAARLKGQAQLNLQKLINMHQAVRKVNKSIADYSVGQSMAASIVKDSPKDMLPEVLRILTTLGFDTDKLTAAQDPRIIQPEKPVAPEPAPTKQQPANPYDGKSTRDILAILKKNTPRRVINRGVERLKQRQGEKYKPRGTMLDYLLSLPRRHPARVAFRKAYKSQKKK